MAKIQPHVASPASAKEITQSIKATREDIRRVDRVLSELGLISENKSDKVMRRSATTGKFASKTQKIKSPGGGSGAQRKNK